MNEQDHFYWWAELRHEGMLLDPARLRTLFSGHLAPLPQFQQDKLRRWLTTVNDDPRKTGDFCRFLLEDIAGFIHTTGTWERGNGVGSEWSRPSYTGGDIKPRHIWIGRNGGRLPVFIDTEPPRLGIGRGVRILTQAREWLRAADERLALVTNGRQFRLQFVHLDTVASTEWSTDLWFQEGEPSGQVEGWRRLFDPVIWIPEEEGKPAALVQAILDSRKGQAELSTVLGERVREAVEMLVREHGQVLTDRAADVDGADIYRAAVRMVMRMVVVLFAEARDLLPRSIATYHQAYGLQGLREQLERTNTRGGARLAHAHAAWPRILALFQLVRKGSHHEAMPIPAYGGELFASGDEHAADPVSRIIHIFETACFHHDGVMSDHAVYDILEKLTRTKVKIRQGTRNTWMPAPVDFSDLSSEYIGILYEGLLDFELRTAPDGDPIIFLNIGAQPALPLSRLEDMDNKAIKALLEKMKDKGASSDDEEEDADAEEEAEDSDLFEQDDESEDAEDDDSDSENEEDAAETRQTTRTRAETWARRAVEAGKLVKAPKGKKTPEKHMAHEQAIERKARQLVSRVVLPGEWYLVRWGGTRKGSGTFYTRPQLAIPTVQRTLRPLAAAPPTGPDGQPDIDAHPRDWTPRKPEDILAIKVCDPACGSGSFPIAALRFLTDTLYDALHLHGRIEPVADRSLIALLTGEDTDERLVDEQIPCRPDEPTFEPRLKAILRRHVVERCIYGVDHDPLAVELCRLALWIETMDRQLPFSFLDHKIKCGNALIGCWFDQFRHYPAMAWEREGGDKSHTNGVHFKKEERTKAIREVKNKQVKPDLAEWLDQSNLFTQGQQTEALTVHDDALAVLRRVHALPVHEHTERSRVYREEVLGSQAWQDLKGAFDRWCALWFWPAHALEHAPLGSAFARPTEEAVGIARQVAAAKRFFHWELEFPDVFDAPGSGFDAMIGNPPWDIAKPNSKEFFSGIDPLYRSYGKQEAINHQRGYFENEAIESRWLDYNADFRAQSNFMKYAAAPWGDPDADGDNFSLKRGKANLELHETWREQRASSTCYADPAHPYRHQGSADINLYKLFLEQAHHLLRRGGRLGFVVPSGIYSDHGTGALRVLFLDHCQWEWLFSFENKEGIFDIHRSYKFNPVIAQKGGRTEAIRAAFMERNLEAWTTPQPRTTHYTRAQVERFSPRSRAILEIQSQRDLEILEKIYANSVLLGDDGPDGWGIKYATEFHMTNDSKLFPPRPKWEAKGYRPDEYSRWLLGDWQPIDALWAELGVKPLAEGDRRVAQPPYDTLPIPRADIPEGIILSRNADAWIREDEIGRGGRGCGIALPIYEGRMIGQLDFSNKGWVSGTGRSAKWRDIPWESKQLEPQYLIDKEVSATTRLDKYLKAVKKACGKEFAKEEAERLSDDVAFDEWIRQRDPQLAFMDITSATNQRTTIAALTYGVPCGNSAPILLANRSDLAAITAVLNTFAFDAVARRRCGGLHLNWFVIAEAALPRARGASAFAEQFGLRLSAAHFTLSPHWIGTSPVRPWRLHWAVTPAERVRIWSSMDAIVASMYGLDSEDLRDTLVHCDLRRSDINAAIERGHLSMKGFWRVDKDKDPELRHTILTLAAFRDLEQMIADRGGDRDAGIEAFCTQNDGEGWMLPETLRLADLGLGHDDRARHPQPVASRLGPRFYDWQTAQTPEESWRECELHARNLLGEEGFAKLKEEIAAGQ